MENRGTATAQRARLRGREGECARLDSLVADVRRGESRSLVLRGEAGIGKSALLEYLAQSASDVTVLRTVGVESEMELAYAGLHQLCLPLFDRLGGLPGPQREALEVAFGVSAGAAPDRFLIGLAALGMLSAAAEERPVLCLIDDSQWLDRGSLFSLGFVARRLLADRVGLVFAARESGDELSHLPEIEVAGLRNGDARALLGSALRFRLDEQVRDRIVAETRGNPLALLELPRALSATELAGFGTAAVSVWPSDVEESFRRRLEALPPDTRVLLLVAAADPLGDPVVVWRAAELQGIRAGTAAPASEEGLCELGARVRFRHPLVRSIAYRMASADERRRAHAALAAATDAETDPDRRAWHRALAAEGPDDAAADELERSATRARARGGQAAAAAFLERSVDLTVDPARRTERALAAAEARYLAGSGEDALRLAALAESGPLDEPLRVRVDVLRARLAAVQRRPRDAPLLLLRAARRLERFDPRLARDTYLEALTAATYAGRLAGETGMREVAAAIRSAAPLADSRSPADELLDAAAVLVDAGFAKGAEAVRRALAPFLIPASSDGADIHWRLLAGRVSSWVWDDEAWDAISNRTLELVRDAGVLSLLPNAAAARIAWELFAGDLTSASTHVSEQEAVQEALGGGRSSGSRIVLAAYRGRAAEVAELDETRTRDAVARGDGAFVAIRHWATAVLCNGLGRYDEAVGAARQAAAYPPDMQMSNWALGELVEAAARSGQPDQARDALGRLEEISQACGTEWILGVDARARALLDERGLAEGLYQEAIDRLGRTRLVSELARAQLVYGEWLRRENRRVDARTQLRAAYHQFNSIGMEAFRERARMELLATGEKMRKRTAETRDELTAQEREIARLARDGVSNAQIGARLFLSSRTIEWHLRNVYTKLGIHSRRELMAALASSDGEPRRT